MVYALVVRRYTQLAKAQKRIAPRLCSNVHRTPEIFDTEPGRRHRRIRSTEKPFYRPRLTPDEGRNGLRINGRPGLIELIEMFNLVTQTLISSIQNQAAYDVTAISFAVVAVFATDKGGGGVFHAAACLPCPVRATILILSSMTVGAAAPWLHPTAPAQPDVALLNG